MTHLIYFFVVALVTLLGWLTNWTTADYVGVVIILTLMCYGPVLANYVSNKYRKNPSSKFWKQLDRTRCAVAAQEWTEEKPLDLHATSGHLSIDIHDTNCHIDSLFGSISFKLYGIPTQDLMDSLKNEEIKEINLGRFGIYPIQIVRDDEFPLTRVFLKIYTQDGQTLYISLLSKYLEHCVRSTGK
jgi:hypothetical protein